MSRLSWFLVALALLPAAGAAAGDAAEVRVTHGRVSLLDVMPTCPERACAMDLGPAPPPGTSWLVDAAVIRNALASAGEDPKRFGPIQAVRVVSAARTLTPEETDQLVRSSIERALPAGVALSGLEAKSRLTLPLLATAGETILPKLPRRAGAVTTTAMVEILLDGAPVRKVPIQVRLSVDTSAAQVAVPRGQTLTLVIERRSATISTDGVAIRDTEIGEVAPFRVQRTGRVLNAKVISAGVARVLEVD